MLIVRNQSLLDFIRFKYTAEDVQRIFDFLQRSGTFRFPRFANGLFPAAGFDATKEKLTGYHNVWVRDNVFVAHAHYVMGRRGIALKAARALAAFFKTQQRRFLEIINGEADIDEQMNRPHIRFDNRGREITELWSHAQNDALGYFLWFYCTLILDRALAVTQADLDLLASFALYFKAIRFWNDPDAGHWEEHRKLEASSIGVVTAALRTLKLTMKRLKIEHGWEFNGHTVDVPMVDALVAEGLRALNKILPGECAQRGLVRRYDAALLFLVYPMDIVSAEMGGRIIEDVRRHLEGDYGIRRYLGDSYWGADYKERLPAKLRTATHGIDSLQRDILFKGNPEAQWCLFDPIVSIIHGRKYRQSRNRLHLQSQISYLNRSFGQITDFTDASGPYKCPESYYFSAGRYVPNDHTPLLWTQANLWVALQCLIDNLR